MHNKSVDRSLLIVKSKSSMERVFQDIWSNCPSRLRSEVLDVEEEEGGGGRGEEEE